MTQTHTQVSKATPYKGKTRTHSKTDILYFEDLKPGERFYWGGQEHIRTITVHEGVSVTYPLGLGYSNTIRISDNQVSGMGDKVEVTRVINRRR